MRQTIALYTAIWPLESKLILTADKKVNVSFFCDVMFTVLFASQPPYYWGFLHGIEEIVRYILETRKKIHTKLDQLLQVLTITLSDR